MKAVAITDRGLMRPNNEDTVFCSVNKVGKLPNLFVVADGMGGANAGEYASAFAIKHLISKIRHERHAKEHLTIIEESMESANSELYADSRKHPEHKGCGTTMTAAVIDNGTLYVANVGDSRLYVISDTIRQITHDHSYVEEMVSSGRMVRGSQDYLSKKNIITRAVGSSASVQADLFDEPLAGNEYILLCTDGLSNMLDDETIFSIVTKSDSVDAAAQKLIESANEQGGNDNISVILISGLEVE